MAAARIQNTTLKDNTFGNIRGDFLSHNTVHVTYNTSPAAAPGRARGYMPAANGKLFGREDDIREIIRILVRKASSRSKPVRFALLGAGGQGKTALALEVMAQLAMKKYFSAKNSIWVPCEEATSLALFLDVLFTSLNITKDSHNTIQDILAELNRSSDPIILLLDNFETPWNAPGARGPVSRILRDIAQFRHVTLFITMRATVAPCEEIAWIEKRIQSLDPEASRRLYTSIDQKAQRESKLRELLDMLGHMALAVKLMARHGKNTGYTVEELIVSYRATGTAMLGRSKGSDPQNSVSVSICMSLENSLVKNELNALRLLSIIAMLPSGATLHSLRESWASTLQNLDRALGVLLEVSLLERQRTTYFVLPVIRSYLLDPSRLSNDVRESMVDAACKFLQKHNSTNPGEPFFQDDMTERAIEEINLQAILLETSESNPKVIEALRMLAWHQYQVRPRTEVIERAVKLISNITDQLLVGQVRDCYGAILKALNHFNQSLKQYQLVREAFLAASEPVLAAWVLLDMADIYGFLYPDSFDEIPFIEQAQRELQSIIYDLQRRSRPRIFMRHFSRILNNFKNASTSIGPKPEIMSTYEPMVHCLRRLGKAHSRRGNFPEAIQHLRAGRDLCASFPYDGANCAEELAWVYWALRQFGEAERWCLLSVKEWKQMGSYPRDALRVLGIIYISKGQYHKAVTCLEEGLDYAKARRDQRSTADLLVQLGRAIMKKQNGDDARPLFMEALVHYRDLPKAGDNEVACRFYLDKLKDPLRVPTYEEQRALWWTNPEDYYDLTF
ncbi:hypothetical protein C8J56DRAFT_1166843 [Mycena floridula]|nr:hypothetical protein C8J56DRAFT_1166843 [Mycena floridula]